MAIFPLYSTTIINKDVLTASPFKAGMAIIMDSNGRAIKADSQLLISTSVQEKYARFLGFAASDHDISGNTLIVPDVVGSNYLDANNRFINNQNLEYSVPKRALLDLQDTAVSNFYNASDPNIISRRGIGVYNTTTDYFITDQFVPVLHGDYGFDSTTIVSINPGDILTFGGGVNAGKLVKVNADSFGPDVLVVAIVEKYIPSTGLLHFRQVNYSLSFGTNPYILAIDAGNAASYVNGSSTTTNLVNGISGGTLINGTSYSSANSGAWIFDGANDYINTSFDSSPFTTNATMLLWLQLDTNTPDGGQTGLLGFAPGFAGNNHYPWPDGQGYFTVFRTGRVNNVILSSLNKSTIHLLVVTTDNTDWKLYQNTTLVTTAVSTGSVQLSNPVIGVNDTNFNYNYKGKIFQFNLLNQALTATQITNYYNATKSRYGL
jgi:hypothetical protein